MATAPADNPKETIKKYYLLCTSAAGMKRHTVEDMRDNISVIFTKKEVNLYFRDLDGAYIAREIVVGGSEHTPRRGRVIVI